MQNYMVRLITTSNYKPRYYDSLIDKVIMGTHVARYFGCSIARMLCGFPSIDDTFLTREPLFHIGLCTESMPKGALYDMARCMHFCDDWELDNGLQWQEIYLDKKNPSLEGTARHCLKFAIVEDAFNEAWILHIKFGECLTFDESHTVGWYHGCIRIGPEPKPI